MASVPPPPPPPGIAYPHPGAPPSPPERPEGLPRAVPSWAAWTAPVSLIAGLSVALFAYVVIGAIAGAAGADAEDSPPGVQIAATVVQDGALIGSALLFARLAAPPRPWQFGLRGVRLAPAAGWTALAWFAFFAFTATWVSALGIEERDDLPEQLGVDDSTVALVAVAVLVTVVAPVAEEVFFRGYFFTALRGWRGVWPAAVLTGVVFGGIHAGSAPPGYLVPLAVFGAVLCLLYWRTGSLYPCIALHALNNSLAFGVTQGWDWQVPLLMVGANAAIFAFLVPLGRREAPAGVSVA